MTSEILKTLYQYGNQYFTAVEELYKLFNDNRQVVYDSAEVLYFIHNGEKRGFRVTRERIAENLYLDIQKVDRAISYLKEKRLVEVKRSYKINKGAFGQTDLSFFLNSQLDSLTQWYEDPLRWDFIAFIHTVSEMIGLETGTTSRRQLVRCLCLSCENCKCKKDVMLCIKRDVKRLEKIEEYYKENRDRYKNDLHNLWSFRSERYKQLNTLNQVRYCFEKHFKKQPDTISDRVWNLYQEFKELNIPETQLDKRLYRSIVVNTKDKLEIYKKRLSNLCVPDIEK